MLEYDIFCTAACMLTCIPQISIVNNKKKKIKKA